MKIFLLYQTDLHKTKKNEVCFGAFESLDKANQAAKDYDLYNHYSQIIIKETILNKFVEL